MRLLSLLFSVLISIQSEAQQPVSPATVPPAAAPGLTPTEMNALMTTLVESEAKSKQQQPSPQPNPAQQETLQPAPPLEPQPAPPAIGSPNVNPNNNKSLNAQGSRNKSPFMIPTDLYNRVKQMQTVTTPSSEGAVDNQVEVRRRWPLRDYNLVAVMWGVKSPKAMISDRENKLHVFRVKDYIANSEGYISEITNGEVIVIERGAEIKLKLKSR
jgi:Tfp pilus assembly protein PilP